MPSNDVEQFEVFVQPFKTVANLEQFDKTLVSDAAFRIKVVSVLINLIHNT